MILGSQDCTKETLTPLRLTTKTLESRGHTLDHLCTRQKSRLHSMEPNLESLGHSKDVLTTPDWLHARSDWRKHLRFLLLALCLLMGVVRAASHKDRALTEALLPKSHKDEVTTYIMKVKTIKGKYPSLIFEADGNNITGSKCYGKEHPYVPVRGREGFEWACENCHGSHGGKLLFESFGISKERWFIRRWTPRGELGKYRWVSLTGYCSECKGEGVLPKGGKCRTCKGTGGKFDHETRAGTYRLRRYAHEGITGELEISLEPAN